MHSIYLTLWDAFYFTYPITYLYRAQKPDVFTSMLYLILHLYINAQNNSEESTWA